MKRAFLPIALCTSFTACNSDSRSPDEHAAAQAALSGPAVSLQVVADDPPSLSGGAVLVDGVYDLVANKVYVGPGGDTSSVPRTLVAERLIIDGGKIKFVATQKGETTSALASLTFCGAGLGLTFTSGPNTGMTRALGFRAEGDELEILDQNQARTYVVRTGTEMGVEQPATGAACKQAPGVCGGLANIGPWVVEQSATADAPVGTGGALLLDTPYVMNSDVYYNDAPPSGSRDKITLVVHADTTFEFVSEIDHEGALRLSGTYTTVGNLLTFNVTCSPFGAVPLPFNYNAQRGLLQTIQTGGPNHDTGTECMTYHAVK